MGEPRKKRAINQPRVGLRDTEWLDYVPPGPPATCDPSLCLLPMLRKHEQLALHPRRFSRIRSLLFPMFLFFLGGFSQLWTLRTIWLRMAWAFLREPSLRRRRGEALLQSSAYITSFDKYDTCPETRHFARQTFYGAALCFKHNTAFKERVII